MFVNESRKTNNAFERVNCFEWVKQAFVKCRDDTLKDVIICFMFSR